MHTHNNSAHTCACACASLFAFDSKSLSLRSNTFDLHLTLHYRLPDLVSGSNAFALIEDRFWLFHHLFHDRPVQVVLSYFFQSPKPQNARIHSHHQSMGLPRLENLKIENEIARFVSTQPNESIVIPNIL